MLPSTLTSLLVFLASVGPGYVFVQVLERHRAGRDRTALRETAEMVVSGALCTLTGVVIALALVQVDDMVDTTALISDPGKYLVDHPVRTGFALLVTLAASYGLAYLAARLMPGKGARVYADSAWYGAFERDLPEAHGTVATVELKDGRVLAGAVRAYTAEACSVDERELTLAAPPGSRVRWRLPSGSQGEFADDFVILRGSDIAHVSASYRSRRTLATSASRDPRS